MLEHYRHMRKNGLSFTAIILAIIFMVNDNSAFGGDFESNASIKGRVAGKNGPEAGVWVIAETDDLKTRYIKIVVTDDQGRFVLPEMPKASYSIWVRGYGLKDSGKVDAKPGDELVLEAAYPSSPQESAQIYPANYWFSLVNTPKNNEFPGTGYEGNGISESIPTREAWVNEVKRDCLLCHQLGNKQTREISDFSNKFENTKAAWSHRLSLGPYGGWMNLAATTKGYNRIIDMFADWSHRIHQGEVPPQPPRPEGIERNLVITMWDWGREDTGIVHDEITTDKRNPLVNANGPYYGVAEDEGELLILDPNTHTSTILTVPLRDKDTMSAESSGIDPSDSNSDVHNPMMDAKGRVWMTSRVRKNANPGWCKPGSTHPSAKYFPIDNASKHVSYYDPKTKQFTLVDTCYSTHHLQFASDANDTLWLSGDKKVIGWLNTKMLDDTGDEQAAQAWCPTVIDTNGDGKVSKPWNEPGDDVNPALDTRVGGIGAELWNTAASDWNGFAYGIIPNPLDDSVWITRPWPSPGQIVRLERGNNPPETCQAEVYQPPFNNAAIPRKDWGYGPRGIDIDTNGVIWTALAGSSDLASFDRGKCKVKSGPSATGQHCPEGWTLYPAPGPKMTGVDSAPGADFHYYNWVDQFDTLGLGKNTPIINGTTSDSLLALNPDTAKWVVMRVPYPLGFYSRGLDGRIDDPQAGWKGSAVYADYGGLPMKHVEGGKGTKSKVVKFQFRPNPLAE